MIVRLVKDPFADIGLSQLIELCAYLHLPVRVVPASKYRSSAFIANKLGISKRKLENKISTSTTMHGVRLKTGELLIHPDGLALYLQAWGKRFITDAPLPKSASAQACAKRPLMH